MVETKVDDTNSALNDAQACLTTAQTYLGPAAQSNDNFAALQSYMANIQTQKDPAAAATILAQMQQLQNQIISGGPQAVPKDNADPLAESRAKLQMSEEYIQDQLSAKKVTLALANQQEIPLPVTEVRLLTGVNAENNTLDLRVTVPDLNVVGERKVADEALAVLKEIPVLTRHFNLDQKAPENPAADAGTPPKADTLPPVAFSWGPDQKTVDIKFTFGKDVDPLAVVDEIYAMRVARDKEKLRAANAAPAAAAEAASAPITINNMVVNSGPVGDATVAPVASAEAKPEATALPVAAANPETSVNEGASLPVASGFTAMVKPVEKATPIVMKTNPNPLSPEGIAERPKTGRALGSAA